MTSLGARRGTWRCSGGALTGAREVFDREVLSDREVCLSIPRCRLVLLHKGSDLVDAKLTSTADVPMSDFLQKGSLFVEERKNKMPYKEQLGYKALIVMEGNDLAEGLRWSLLSRSVVLIATAESDQLGDGGMDRAMGSLYPARPPTSETWRSGCGGSWTTTRWRRGFLSEPHSSSTTLSYTLTLRGTTSPSRRTSSRRYRRYFIEDTRYDAEKM